MITAEQAQQVAEVLEEISNDLSDAATALLEDLTDESIIPSIRGAIVDLNEQLAVLKVDTNEIDNDSDED